MRERNLSSWIFVNTHEEMSKGSCNLAVWALVWLQVCQGVQRLDVFPSCSCQGLGCYSLQIRTSWKILVLYYSEQNVGECIWFLSIPRAFITCILHLAGKQHQQWFLENQTGLSFSPKLFRIVLHLSHIIFLLETVLGEAKLSSSFTQVPSQSAPVASTECDFKFQGTPGYLLVCKKAACLNFVQTAATRCLNSIAV